MEGGQEKKAISFIEKQEHYYKFKFFNRFC